MSIKAIIFDFFGVISSEVAPFWFAERFPEEKAKRLKDEYLSPADRGDVNEEELFRSLSELTGEDAKAIEEDFGSRVHIDTEMVRFIEELGTKYRVALLSNAMPAWLGEIMEKNDLNRLFSVRVISGVLHVIKPEAEIFEIALERLGIRPCEAVFIDDNPTNVKGAEAVGLNAVVYKDIPSLKRELIKLGIKI